MYNEVEYISSLVKLDNGNIVAVTDGINTCINEYLYVISKKILFLGEVHMDLVFIIISLVLAYVIEVILYGVSIVIGNSKVKIKGSLIMPIVSIIPTILLLIITRINIFKIEEILNVPLWIILIITVAVVVLLISQNNIKEQISKTEIIINGFEGIMMEIPQRMFMQTFIFVFLEKFNVNNSSIWTVIINGIVWCLGIITQGILIKKKVNKQLMIDIVSSFIFSIGIGYVFVKSGLILLIAHFLERVLSKTIMNIKYKISSNKNIVGN